MKRSEGLRVHVEKAVTAKRSRKGKEAAVLVGTKIWEACKQGACYGLKGQKFGLCMKQCTGGK